MTNDYEYVLNDSDVNQSKSLLRHQSIKIVAQWLMFIVN